jgi:hypothetical protein
VDTEDLQEVVKVLLAAVEELACRVEVIGFRMENLAGRFEAEWSLLNSRLAVLELEGSKNTGC